MPTTEAVKVIDEVRQITGDAVAKKQDAAKLNYPKIIEEIKIAARRGDSFLILSMGRMNEYDKQLLEKDGFRVSLQSVDTSSNHKLDYLSQYIPQKEWIIKW